MKKFFFVVFLVTIISLLLRFYFGVYEHDEFTEKNFFIKHRPTWKWYFYSPIRMSDVKFESLSKENQIEQKYFDEFITNQGLSR